jgi:signal peptidase I
LNFALILFLLTLATGAIWLFDVLVMKKRRAPGASEPWWMEYGASFFPVILAVFFHSYYHVETIKNKNS